MTDEQIVRDGIEVPKSHLATGMVQMRHDEAHAALSRILAQLQAAQERVAVVNDIEAELDDRCAEIERLRGVAEQAASECEALAPTWHGAGKGQLLGIAVRLRALTPEGTQDDARKAMLQAVVDRGLVNAEPFGKLGHGYCMYGHDILTRNRCRYGHDPDPSRLTPEGTQHDPDCSPYCPSPEGTQG